MAYLVDTNVAVRRVLPTDPQHTVVTQAIDSLRQQGEILSITVQIIIENIRFKSTTLQRKYRLNSLGGSPFAA